MLWLLNPIGILLVLLSLGVSILLYREVKDKKDRVNSIGSMTRNITYLIGFVYPFYYLGHMEDLELVGHGTALSLFLLIFGTAIHIICKLIIRFKK